MSISSAVYRINSSGSRTEPCGTEHVTRMTREDVPSTTTQAIIIIKEIYIAPFRHAPKALCKQKVKCRELLLNVREMLVMSHHHTAEQLANCSILQDQRQRSFCLRSRSSVEQLVDKAGLSADENVPQLQ